MKSRWERVLRYEREISTSAFISWGDLNIAFSTRVGLNRRDMTLCKVSGSPRNFRSQTSSHRKNRSGKRSLGQLMVISEMPPGNIELYGSWSQEPVSSGLSKRYLYFNVLEVSRL